MIHLLPRLHGLLTLEITLHEVGMKSSCLSLRVLVLFPKKLSTPNRDSSGLGSAWKVSVILSIMKMISSLKTRNLAAILTDLCAFLCRSKGRITD